ncbi:MAG: sulfurtransferase [Deltaproteobacteria bacterium]|nr:sulfurtransferase [Deltaproteobacteria bacterium]
MYDDEFEDISAEVLKQFIRSRNEKDYVLVDVRQPDEYQAGHIPGSLFIPLSKLIFRFSDLPRDKEMVFYCHSGGRSMAAASMVSEEGITNQKIYNLEGGILAWDGKTMKGFPRIQVFDKAKTPGELLFTAMDLEKGAWRFYTHVLKHFSIEPLVSTLEPLSKAEVAHARTVYEFWKTGESTPPPFDDLYDSLSGEILEGGAKLGDVLGRLESVEENLCLRVIELALHIEYAALDLYRAMAEQSKEETVQKTLLAIAQAEKSHIRLLTRALDKI